VCEPWLYVCLKIGSQLDALDKKYVEVFLAYSHFVYKYIGPLVIQFFVLFQPFLSPSFFLYSFSMGF